MKFQDEYADHDVHVWTEDIGKRFRWHYTIDSQHLTTGEDSPLPSEDLVCNEGVQAARRRIDGWLEVEGKARLGR